MKAAHSGSSLRTGSAATSALVARVAEHLLGAYPSRLRVLAGLQLVEPATGAWVPLDLVAVSDTAVVVGVEARLGSARQATPQAAALNVARLLRERQLQPALPVYAFWLGQSPPAGYTGGAPALAGPEAVQHFIEQASARGTAAPHTADRLAEHLLQADVGPVEGAVQPPGAITRPAARRPQGNGQAAAGALRRVLRDLRDLPGQVDASLRERIRQPLPWRRGQPVRPAEVQERLAEAMLAPENVLEDARYFRIVPNDYLVELNPLNYERHYRLIERRVCAQWADKLREALNTANQRQGRTQYQFGGRVQVHVRPGPGLAEDEVRVRARVLPDPEPASTSPEPEATGDAPPTIGCLELLGTRQRWPVREGTVTLGRHADNDVRLDVGRVRDMPLISSHHAYLVVEDGYVRLHDGSLEGRPSLNGTFLNGRRVPTSGLPLADGDVLVLAPLHPDNPRPDAPGAVALRYRAGCEA